MPKIGDGTGMGSMPPETDGLTGNQDKTPQGAGKGSGNGEGGTGPQKESGGNRTSPVRGG